MELKTEKQDNITIIKIEGNLDGTTSKDAQDQIMPLLESDCIIVFDMEKCQFISSAGLRVLLMAAKELSKIGGKAGLACLSDEIAEVLKMTGFDNIFQSYDSVEEATAALQK